jgi:hypothetical protein
MWTVDGFLFVFFCGLILPFDFQNVAQRNFPIKSLTASFASEGSTANQIALTPF